MPKPRADIATQLGDAIERHQSEIEHRWLTRVQTDVVRTPGVELTQLRDGIPEYLVEVVNALRSRRSTSLGAKATAAWSKIAREHGVTRVRIGFDIGQLIHEFVVLRHVIRDVACEQHLGAGGPEALLADILDGAIAAAVQAYVEARDHEVRRVQAESIAFVTHELRNPLSTAQLAATQLRARARPEQAQPLGVLDRSLQKLSKLVDSVLLTQALEAGQVEIRPVEVPLGQLVDPALEAAKGAAERKGLGFHARYDAALTVRVDPALARSAIQNVVDNAVKYTDTGHVDVVVEERPDEVAIEVTDTCHGLTPEELRTIFEPFRRGRSKEPGTGLGLAIARRAVEAQGGSISAESSGPLGCRFSIRFPKRR